MIKISTVLIAVVLSANLFGQNLETDRPDQTESSNTVPKGTIQIESGIGVEITGNNLTGATRRSFALPTTLFRIAVANKFELRVVNTLRNNRIENVYYKPDGDWQIDDLQLGFKWKIAEGNGLKPQFSLMSHAVLPTGTGNGTDYYGVVNKLLISHDFKNGCGLGYNLGYSYLGPGDGDLTYSISFAMPITDRVGAYIESYGELVNIEDFVSSADAGLTFLWKENIQLDYSFGLGVNHRMNYHALGLSIRLPK